MIFVNLTTSVLIGCSHSFLYKLNIEGDDQSAVLYIAWLFVMIYLIIGFLEIAFLRWSIKKISD